MTHRCSPRASTPKGTTVFSEYPPHFYKGLSVRSYLVPREEMRRSYFEGRTEYGRIEEEGGVECSEGQKEGRAVGTGAVGETCQEDMSDTESGGVPE